MSEHQHRRLSFITPRSTKLPFSVVSSKGVSSKPCKAEVSKSFWHNYQIGIHNLRGNLLQKVVDLPYFSETPVDVMYYKKHFTPETELK